MKLNIVNPTAISFHEAVGITEERSNELGAKMDMMTKSFYGHVVRTVDVFNEIASFCTNAEELIFCTISHCNYMMINHGIFLCPPKKVVS